MKTLMGKYFNNDTENFGGHSFRTLRIEDGGEGFSIMKGGMVDQKGKLKQADVLAFCETKEEAEQLVEKLCTL